MQEVFNYTNDGIKYVCYLKDNQVVFGKVIDNNIDSNLNEEELKQMISIYMFLFNNQKDSIRIKDIKLADTTFEVYYNSSNDLYTFTQKDHFENKAFLPILNNAFNNRENKLYIKEGKLSKFIRITVLVGVATMTVNVSAFLNNNSLPMTFKDYDDFEKGYKVSTIFREEIETYDNADYKWEDIKAVIDNNQNLSKQEKEFLYHIREQLEDNLDYIDLAIIKRNLSEVKFVYHPYVESDEQELIVCKGSYVNMGTYRNQIDFYGTARYPAESFNSISEAAAEHEVGHALTKYSLGYTYPGFIGDVKQTQYYLEDRHFDKIAEGINELFSREYSHISVFSEKSKEYQYLMPAIYTLCEVLEPEVLKCYKYNCNLYYITNALNKLGIPLEDIHDFYNAINLYITALDEVEEDKDYSLAGDAAKKAYHYLNEFYYTKYGKNIEDNLALSAAFYHTPFISFTYSEGLERKLGMYDFDYYPRNYINSKKIDKNPVPYIAGVNEFGNYTEAKLDGTYNPEKEVVK